MRWLLLACLLVGPLRAAPAVAQVPDAVRRVRIVVPTARGRKQYGGQALTRSLRRTLGQGIGAVIPAKALRQAQRDLSIDRKDRYKRDNLARAGRKAGADYVLYTRITRKGWLYTAQARLVNTVTGEVQMDFRSQYYDPKADTEDRGQRIGNRTLLKLQTLAEEGQLAAPAPSRPAAVRSPTTSPDAAPPPAPSGGGAAPPEALAQIEPRAATGEGAEANRQQPARPFTDTRASDARPPSPAAVQATAERADSPATTVRFEITGGAGLLRRYDVSSANVRDSGLSYPLDPTSLVRLGAELRVPDTAFGIDADVALRPVQYEVGPIGQPPQTPSGLLVDSNLWATYYLSLASSGRQAIQLIPKLGMGIDVAPVSEHAGNFVVSSTGISVLGGLGARIPVNDILEVSLAIAGGWIASYSESPTVSGTGGSGFRVDGDVDVRLWLSSNVGIAFDTRYRFTRIGFDGAPTRKVPDAELGQLDNVTLSTQDLLTSVGLALRF